MANNSLSTSLHVCIAKLNYLCWLSSIPLNEYIAVHLLNPLGLDC